MDDTCVWTFDDYHCFWETSCGRSWCFDSSLEDTELQFCPGCGKPIKEDKGRDLEIDEQWLLECGWTQIGNTFYMPESMAPPGVNTPILFWVRVNGAIYIAKSDWKSKPNATRGQLMDLIAAMGLGPCMGSDLREPEVEEEET